MNRIVIVATVVTVLSSASAGTDSTTDTSRGWLGVITENLSPAVRVALQAEHGVVVSSVVDSGPADRCGIKVGDVILSVAGERIDATGDLRHAVRSRANQVVEVELLRQGRRLSVRAQLATRSDHRHGNLGSGLFELEDLDELRDMLSRGGPGLLFGRGSLEAEIDSLRAELEHLRQELEELRVQLRSRTRGN